MTGEATIYKNLGTMAGNHCIARSLTIDGFFHKRRGAAASSPDIEKLHYGDEPGLDGKAAIQTDCRDRVMPTFAV